MNQYNFKWLVCLFIGLFLLYGQTSKAQIAGTPYITPVKQITAPCLDKSTSGTEFFFTYGSVYTNRSGVSGLIFLLHIAALEDTQVTITIPNPSENYTFTVSANTVKRIDFNAYEGITGSPDVRGRMYLNTATGTITNRTIRITSDKPISVYNYSEFTDEEADASMVIPTSLWGTEYYNISYRSNVLGNNFIDVLNSEIIMAKEDNTVITLPPIPPATNSTTQTLNTGNLFVTNVNRADHTGRHITSTKPIGYIASAAAANVPTGRNFADNIFEQLMPVNQWGKFFLVPNIRPGSNNGNVVVRILAAQDGTTVTYTNAAKTTVVGSTSINSGGTLNKGQWVEIQISGNAENIGSYITSTKPVGVTTYMIGSQFANLGGDPSIAWVPPLQQMVQKTLVAPFIHNTTDPMQHRMLIVAKTTDKASTTINGTVLTTGWVDDASGYSFYRYVFTNSTDFGKTFKVENLTAGVLVSIYGFTDGISYHYNAGSGGCIINP